MTQAAKVGTVFVRSWGYDQTNVDFYEVVSISASGKTGKAREIKGVAVSATAVTAATDADRFVEGARCAKCSNHHRNAATHEIDKNAAGYDGHAYRDTYTYQAKTDRVTVTDYGDHAYRWDGGTEYRTAAGYGH
jgi:hypothetical protein